MLDILLTTAAVLLAVIGTIALVAPRIYDEKTPLEYVLFLSMSFCGFTYLIMN